MRAPRITLLQAFVAGAALVAVLLGVLAAVVLEGSRRSILASAEKLRAAAALRVEEMVLRQLSVASGAVDAVERDFDRALARPDDRESMEAALFRQIAADPLLAEVGFIRADRVGYDAQGEIELAPKGRWQVSVSRAGAAADSAIVTRVVSPAAQGFEAGLRTRTWDAEFPEGKHVPEGRRPIRPRISPSAARLRAQIDAALPRERRRILVSVQEAIEDSDGPLPRCPARGDPRQRDRRHREPQGRLRSRSAPRLSGRLGGPAGHAPRSRGPPRAGERHAARAPRAPPARTRAGPGERRPPPDPRRRALGRAVPGRRALAGDVPAALRHPGLAGGRRGPGVRPYH